MASMRLLCAPFAGGGVGAFRPWAKLLPRHVEAFALQLPGREERLKESAIERWPVMMDALVGAVSALPALPTAIFGHSLGAVIALELARWMQVKQPQRLLHLFAAGRPWPGRPTAERRGLDTLSDDELLEVLDQQYGSMSSSMAHPEIRELALPALRSDLRLLESYEYAAAPPLPCPLTVFGGMRDPVTSPANLEPWRRETAGPFGLKMFDGGHFFLESHREEVVGEIATRLDHTDGDGARA